MQFPPQLHLHLPVAPLPRLRRLLCVLVLLCPTASCSCSDEWNANLIRICFPSFKGASSRLQNSWDAGILDGVLHLTTDDAYQPPVYYPPDAKTSAGYAIANEWWNEIKLVRHNSLGSHGVRQEASFNTTFTMSVNGYRGNAVDGGGILFEILSDVFKEFNRATYSSLASTKDGRRVAVEIGRIDYYYHQDSSSIYVSIAPLASGDAAPAKYTVWIDYNAVVHNMSVYVVEDGEPKPTQPTLDATVNISAIVSDYSDGSVHFGLFASKSRFLPSCQAVVYSWNLTVDRLLDLELMDSQRRSRSRRRRRKLLIILLSSVLGTVTTAMVFVAACYLASRYKALRKKLKLSEALRQLPGVPREFKHATISKATSNFHEMLKLGRGGFGAVYKGTLRSGKNGQDRVEVAVKKFTRKEDGGYGDFLAEVAVISRLRHKNIVPLIGWCYEKGELLLVYEYMPNGSLDQHLFQEKHHRQRTTLLWETRNKIITDVAAGLNYVHHEYERTVLHRDIKPSNIMLDSNFRACLGDFGLARVVAYDKNSITELGVAGTWGFIAPEYPVTFRATRQTDMYAFGVLILEVITGRRSVGAADAKYPLLTGLVWRLHEEGRLLEAVDDDVISMENFDADEAIRLLLLGLACSNPNPSERPRMAEVVQVITKLVPPPDVPLVMPKFVWPPEGGIQIDCDDNTAMSDLDGRNWVETTSSSHDFLAVSVASEITRRKAWLFQPRKSTSSDQQCYV